MNVPEKGVKVYFEEVRDCEDAWNLMIQGMSFQEAADRLGLHEFTHYYAVLEAPNA